MSLAAKSILKPISMATNGCLTSYTSSKTSFSRPNISIPSRPIKIFHISCSFASPIPLSLKRKELILRVSAIAAQQEEDTPVLLEEQGEGFDWAEGGDSEGDTEAFVELSEDAKLYVGNLPYDVDSATLAQVFEGAGTVEIVEIIGNRETGQSRGFGFVTMSTVEEADKAVELFHRYNLNGRLLTVNKAARKGSIPPPRVSEPRNRIYVGNLPWSVDDAGLEQLFSEYGKVVSARVVSDRETGRSRGFGFVVLSSEAEMNDAIANLDGQNLDGRAIRVNVASVRPARGSF